MPYKAPKVKPVQTDTARPPARKREWYGWQHQQLRKLLKATYPLCQLDYQGICTGWTEEAHHKVYPARSIEDYIACCTACHHELERQTQAP